MNISDIEILQMDSADNFDKWRTFLQDYKIKVYYIGDFDNLKRNAISSYATTWTTKYPKKLLRNKIIKIKKFEAANYNNMISEIALNYSRLIFLLYRGSLEDYMKDITGQKGNFEKTVNFCNNNFQTWIKSPRGRRIKEEMDYFFFCIVHS